MKQFILFFLIYGFCISLTAQISHGGRPLMNAGESPARLARQAVTMPELPAYVQQLSHQEPTVRNQPLTFAHPYIVKLSPANSGEWSHENGRDVWRIYIQSHGAYSLNIIFDRFVLAPGSRLFIFNADQSVVYGAFTIENNSPSGILATSPVPGDMLIVELSEPAGIGKKSEVVIGAVNHDFMDLYSFITTETNRFKRSGLCNPDFTCETDPMWLEAGQSVCRVIVDGTELCSGVLVNNTQNDGTPYVLTAAHCLRNQNSHQTVIFTFNYQVPNCDARVEGSFTQTVSGSFQRAFSSELDIALLEMSSAPPATYRPYWAGWSRGASPAAPYKCIHHPQGDVKKVARAESAVTESSFLSFVPNSHWRVASWSSGTTEGGSSGAPLFDAHGRVIGTLSGGSATCASPVNDYFVRINKAWNHFPQEAAQLSRWLDPTGSNLMAVDGFSFYDKEVSRISGFRSDDTAGWEWLTPGTGVWSGHNSRGDKAFAEKYGPYNPITLHGVYVMPSKSKVSSSQTLNLRLWSGNQEPETIIASRDNVSLAQLPANREFLWMFDEPLLVSGYFWAGVELNYYAVTDSFALYQSKRNADKSINSAWVQNNQEWRSVMGWHSAAYATSFWIDLLASDVNPIDTFIHPVKGGMFVYPNPVSERLFLILDNTVTAVVAEAITPSGHLVLRQNLSLDGGKGELFLGHLQPGIYILRVTSGNQYYTEKLMVVSG